MDSLLGNVPFAFVCRHLAAVFSILQDNGLVDNTYIEFLGHRLNSAGISPLLS